MEGELIAIIDIASSLRMDHNSTTGRGGESTTCGITINYIRVSDGDDAVSGNDNDIAEYSIVLSSSLLCWGRLKKENE